MAEIKFGSYSRAYELFHFIFHICAGVVCVIMTAAAIFADNGFVYFPPVFIVCSLTNFLNAYDVMRGTKKNKKKTRGSVFYIIIGAVTLLAGVAAIMCFWV